ncbi:hypothetical protein H8B13_12440 [Hymenobacter sp. BT188]|uniref:hypothetical protein n=1 Tax=Hymenobacter sp. BT188 TaxID=2763504 RepID=UPI0016519302|nr:hypothetical protein [Hymenobacter sp. BT188]MBC6607629.1 hypothetical protein [Hymenobacter sp. BT188]
MHYPPRQRYGPLLLACLLLTISSYAQNKKPLPGYVVTMGGDTLQGAIVPTSRYTQQYQVEFLPIRGHQRLNLDADQLASFTYYSDLDTIRYVSLLFAQKGTNSLNRAFLQQILAGEVQLYHYSFYPRRFGDRVYNPENSLVIYRPDKMQLDEVSGWRFPKDAVAYFGDCPELVADLQVGRYRYRDLPTIVRRYNAWHESQKTTP